MLLPVGDMPNPRSVPVVNILLIVINVAVFLFITLPLSVTPPDASNPFFYEYLQLVGAYTPQAVSAALQNLSAYDLHVLQYGFRPAEPTATALLSSLFLHGGWMHLVGNMLFLWIFGDNIEYRLGHLGYLCAYLLAGVAATLFYALFVLDSPVPLIGASGAISGVLGAYFFWFPRNQVKIFVFLFPLIMTTVLVPARIVLGFYLLIDNLLPFVWNGGAGSGVAHGAHIGGFMAGLGLAWVIDHRHGKTHHYQTASLAEPSPPTENPLKADSEEISRQIKQGNLRWAAGLYFSLNSRAERGAIDAQDVLAIGDYFLQQGDIDHALSLFRRFIAERPTAQGVDRAYLGAGKALSYKPRCSTAAYQYFLNALDCASDEILAAEARKRLKVFEELRVRSRQDRPHK
ncbi:MAG: rhomboid family intramembrane serine protease [Desulfuromonadales bacterium]|nr:rhomboid family intramembrane serine protease [Desulfuromonadales bacterium]